MNNKPLEETCPQLLSFNLDEFWSDVKDVLRKRHIPTFSVVSYAFPISFDPESDVFVLGVCPEVQKILSNKLDHVKTACAIVLGRPIQVRLNGQTPGPPARLFFSRAANCGDRSASNAYRKWAPGLVREGKLTTRFDWRQLEEYCLQYEQLSSLQWKLQSAQSKSTDDARNKHNLTTPLDWAIREACNKATIAVIAMAIDDTIWEMSDICARLGVQCDSLGLMQLDTPRPRLLNVDKIPF